jgi:predicted deacylase
MRRIDHALPAQSPGTQRTLSSWHFGQPGAQPRVYIQAALHADELPGMLVAHQLRHKLEALEQSGQIQGEIVLVPMANPIGLNQSSMGQLQGRFETASGHNFNRGFPDLVKSATDILQHQASLNADARHNQQLVRAALLTALAEYPTENELEFLQKTLFSLALEADVVLDLHCDSEAAMHLYVHRDQLEPASALAGYLGALTTMHTEQQQGQSFDDALSRQWWQLQRQFPDYPIPMACFAATVELRGQSDVELNQANGDADALLEFLRWRGALAGAARTPPAMRYPATALNCTEVLTAPCAGVVAYLGQVGRLVQAGEALAEIIDPLSGMVHTLRSSQTGMYYARAAQRFAHTGAELCFVAGPTLQRSGNLLSP